MNESPPVVPVVDIEPLVAGGPADRLDVAARIDAACRDTGFLLITGHGVPRDVTDACLDGFAAFFDLPLDEKRRAVVADEAADRGYSEEGKETLAYSRGDVTPPDLFEAFNVGREDVVGHYYDTYRSFFAPNLWPERPTGLREAWLAYDAAVAPVVDAVLQAMAIALDLPEQWFTDRCRTAIVTTRANNYVRRSPAPAAPGQMRMGAHTDYGILTLLLADDVPGLQVQRDGTWHDVATPPGTLVGNLGDMLERWTNDRWTSTLHRVVPPPADVAGPVRRRSVARFLDCAPDVIVECIPSCCGPGRPAKYEPVNAGDWLMDKVLRGRTGVAAT
jgi:isopenicillin N synthase-like dioxygenase